MLIGEALASCHIWCAKNLGDENVYIREKEDNCKYANASDAN